LQQTPSQGNIKTRCSELSVLVIVSILFTIHFTLFIGDDYENENTFGTATVGVRIRSERASAEMGTSRQKKAIGQIPSKLCR